MDRDDRYSLSTDGPAPGTLRRRGILAGVAALAAGLLARASEKAAQAADGNSLILGSTTNQAGGETTLTRGSGSPTPNTAFALHVYSNGAAIYGESNGIGVEGVTSSAAGSGTGVFGSAGSSPNTLQIKSGVHGTAVNYAGVLGDSLNSSAVLGVQGGAFVPAGYYAGVLGVAPTGVSGVQGVANFPGPVPPQGTAGVGGTSDNGYGVVGSSSSNNGVYGLSTSSYGVLGQASSGVGARGDSSGNFGLVGSSSNSHGVFGDAGSGSGVFGRSVNQHGVAGQATGGGNGVYGNATSGTGVYGTVSSGIGVFGTSGSGAGVAGTSANNNGVFGDASAAGNGVFARTVNGNGLVAQSTGGGNAAQFFGNVLVQGNFTVMPGFAKSGAVTFADGSVRRLYATEAPESWFEDFGEAPLVNGRASVPIPPDFAQAVNTGTPYYVFAMPHSAEIEALAVTVRAPDHFEVQANGKGVVEGTFAYRIVAKRKGAAAPRFERVTGADQRAPLASDAPLRLPTATELPTLPALPDLPAPARQIAPVPPGPEPPTPPTRPVR